MSLATWFLQRRLRKEIGLSKKEYGMFKKMFVDNWASTLIGLVLSAFQIYQAGGVTVGAAITAAFGVLMRDGIPGIGSKAPQ